MDAIDTVRRFDDAMAAGDVGGLFGLLDAEVTVSQDERLPWGGRYDGHDGFAAFGLRLREAISSQVEHSALFAAGGEVVQYGRTRGTVNATGVAFDLPEVHRFVVRDGRIVAAHFAIDSEGMHAALAAPAPMPAGLAPAAPATAQATPA